MYSGVKLRRAISFVLVFLGFGGFIATVSMSLANGQGNHATLIEIEGVIQPASARFLARAIGEASHDNAEVLIVRLNTPGGLLNPTREMVEVMLASRLPVVVYVAPAGAEATSAGTFIAAAAHVAVMAPSTNIGAASPVGNGRDLPDTLATKATEVAAAFMRSIAVERGRNADALEGTVVGAKAYTAAEALDDNIIDLVARDIETLLVTLDGRKVQLTGGEDILETAGLEIRNINPTLLERFLNFLSDPNIAFLLISLGGMGIFVEMLSPGMLGPGVLGIIALLLALVGLDNLPVNWVGVGLLAFSMALFYLEIQVSGFGVFGVLGAISFVLGAFFLFGGIAPPAIYTPSFRVNLLLIAGVTVVMFAFVTFLVRDMMSVRRWSATSQPSSRSLVGQVGFVTNDIAPRGSVHVAGEEWSAVGDSEEDIAAGEEVVVLDVEGLTLKVFPPDPPQLT